MQRVRLLLLGGSDRTRGSVPVRPSGNGSGHAAWCRSTDSCHCCCYGDSMFTAATHLCVAFRRYLVNRKTQSGEEKKLRGFIDSCERNIFAETLSKPVNIVSKYLLGSKTIRLNRALHYPKQQSKVFHVENCDMKTRHVEDPSVGRATRGCCLMASSCFSFSCFPLVHGHDSRTEDPKWLRKK